MASSTGETPSSPRFDESMQATIGALLTIVLLVLVDLLWAFEKLSYGQSELPAVGIYVFNCGGLFISVWFCVLASREKIDTLLNMFAGATRTDIPAGDAEVLDVENVGGSSRFITNPWIPVTLQFLLAGWLIYASGGITNSPYSSVLIAMMLIGQSLYMTPSVTYDAHAKLLGAPAFMGGFARAYWYPLLMFVSLLVGLVWLQAHHPLMRRPAAAGEMFATTLLNLLVSMCVVFVTRRVDRTGGRGDKGGS
jgi:hypothetical protein